MNFKKSINSFRRALMQGLTRNVGTSQLKTIQNPETEISRILICRPNHRLGNISHYSLIQEVNTFPNSKIDLLTKGGIAPSVFKNYPNIREIIQFPKKPLKELIKYTKVWLSLRKTNYDIVINVIKRLLFRKALYSICQIEV